MATLGAPVRLGADRPDSHRAHRRARSAASWAALVLMVLQVPFFVSIALTSPLAGRIALSLLWLAVFTVGVHHRRRPGWVFALAVAMAGCWYLLGVVAVPYLGWLVR